MGSLPETDPRIIRGYGMRGFPPGSSVPPSPQKPTFPNLYLTWNGR